MFTILYFSSRSLTPDQIFLFKLDSKQTILFYSMLAIHSLSLRFDSAPLIFTTFSVYLSGSLLFFMRH